jgi:hypothetical protein
MAMEGSSGGIEAQPSVRVELLKLLELTPRVQTSQTRIRRDFSMVNLLSKRRHCSSSIVRIQKLVSKL